jgi:hypothetical protein
VTARRGAEYKADPGPPSRVRTLTSQLLHDVGKYLARTARNVQPGERLDPPLLAMLCRDLYGDPGGPRPAARFAALMQELAPLYSDERLGAVADLLSELESLAPPLQQGQPAAVTRALALALQVEQLLRGVAADSQGRRRAAKKRAP